MNLLQYFKREPKPQGPPMACICPNCHHEDRRPKNLARKIGGALGAVAGAACGVYGILGTDRIGMDDVHFPEDIEDFRTDLISLAAATLRAIIGATTGCLVGIRLGELVDAHLLENQTCRQCGHPFGAGMDYVQRPTPFEAASQQGAGNGFARPSGSGAFPRRFGEPVTDIDLMDDEDGDEGGNHGAGYPSRLPPFGFGLGPQDLSLGPEAESGPRPGSGPDTDESPAPSA